MSYFKSRFPGVADTLKGHTGNNCKQGSLLDAGNRSQKSNKTSRVETLFNHDLKSVKKHSVVNARAFHFSNRVVNHWNALSRSQVHACSIAAFKKSLSVVIR